MLVNISVIQQLQYVSQYLRYTTICRLPQSHINLLFLSFSYFIYRSFSYHSGPHNIHGINEGGNPLNMRFPKWVKTIDAAMTWQRNEDLYFFSGRYYWRYQKNERRFMRGYPRKVQEAWRGLPKKLDAAFSSRFNKNTYFISENQIYAIDDR